MSHYLTRLAARSLGLIEVIRPRLPSLFEPPPVADQFVFAQRPGAEMSDVDSIFNGSDSEVFTPLRPLVPPPIRGPLEERPSAEESRAPLNMPHQARNGSTGMPDLHAGQPGGRLPPSPTQAVPQRSEVITERPRTDPAPVQVQPASPQTSAQILQPTQERLSESRAWPQDSDKPKPSEKFGGEETVSRSPTSAAKQLPRAQIEPAVERIVVERFAVRKEPSHPSTEDPTRAAPRRAIAGRQREPLDASEQVVLERLVSPEKPRLPVIPHLEPSEAQPVRMSTPVPIVVQPHVVAPYVERNAEAPANPTAEPVPTIQVTIGRIEVRAMPPPSQPPQRQRSAPAVMSLEEYLRLRRNGGGG